MADKNNENQPKSLIDPETKAEINKIEAEIERDHQQLDNPGKPLADQKIEAEISKIKADITSDQRRVLLEMVKVFTGAAVALLTTLTLLKALLEYGGLG